MHKSTETIGENQGPLRRQVLAFRARQHRRESPARTNAKGLGSDAAASIYSNGTYLAANPTWHVEDSPWKARQVLRMLAEHRIQPKSVAEVGCGAGEILRQLSVAIPGAAFHGFDISADAIALARGKENQRLQFFCSDIRQSARRFDVLLVMDVVEHVEDCFGFLRGIRKKAEYKIFHIPLDMSVSLLMRDRITRLRECVGHLHYFTKATALAMLRETGYQIVDSFYTPEYELASEDLVHQIMAGVRHMGMKVAPDFTAIALGGCPLLVLAK